MQGWQNNILRCLLCVALIMALAGVVAPTSDVLAQDDDNLLQNGGFEGTYIAIGGDPSLQVAPDWQPWSLPPPADAESSAINLRPDYQAAPANRVRSGEAAQEYNTFFATHDGGLFQRVPVEVGAELQFSVYVWVWSSATFEDPDQSIQPQDVEVMVGIDPTGGTDGAADSIVWSEGTTFYDEYQELLVSATAEDTAVTVFIRSTPQGAIGVNNVYVDDAALVQTGSTVVETDDSDADSDDSTDSDTDNSGTDSTDEASDSDDDNDTVDSGDGGASDADDTSSDTDDDSDTSDSDTDSTDADESDGQDDAAEETPELTDAVNYTVQAGDTLTQIATRFDSTVEAITEANGLNEDGFITIGQELAIPVAEGTSSDDDTADDATDSDNDMDDSDTDDGDTDTATDSDTDTDDETPSGSGSYVVQTGDTLFSIARRFNTTVEALATLNNISNPNQIQAGTTLTVPGSAGNNTGTGGSNVGGTTGTHLVATGENAFRIALRYGVTLEALAQANRLTNPNLIFAGSTLVIPQ